MNMDDTLFNLFIEQFYEFYNLTVQSITFNLQGNDKISSFARLGNLSTYANLQQI